MKNCPNCGALINDGQTSCSICNTPITNNNINITNNEQQTVFVNSINNQDDKINKIYEPLNQVEKSNNTTEILNTDDSKKNIMTDILKEQEEKNNNIQKKDDSVKAAILSIVVVIIIILIGYFGVKFGFNKIDDGKDKILSNVVTQANSYTNIVKNYMKKFDYKANRIVLTGYYAKKRTYNFLSIPLSGKCILKEGKWSGSDDDEISCETFFNDINNNYCTSVPCDIPSDAEIYLKETYETMEIDGVEQTITTGTISDGSTLTYDDITCTLSNNNYTCNYIEK